MPTTPHTSRYLVEVLESRIAPATFLVTTVSDAGPGSLRQAILDANALEGADTITFSFPGDDLQVISPLSALPAIIDAVTVSGTGELVQIDGASAGQGVNGLTLQGTSANGSKVVGLQITNFSGSGLVLENVSNTEIAQNNISGNDLHGLHRTGEGGGTGRLDIWGNRFEANNGDGVRLENVTSFIGNNSGGTFGTPRPGNTVEGNGLFGIRLVGGTSTIERNVIRGNGHLESPSNPGGGIAVINASNTEIGTTVGVVVTPPEFNTFRPVVEGNTIVDNVGHGIAVIGSNATGTVVGGNRIRGNAGDGIHIDGAPDTQVGFIAYGRVEHPIRPVTFPVPILNQISDNAGWGVNAINGAWDTAILPEHTFDGNTLGSVFIEDNRPRVSVSSVTLSEGNSGAQMATFVVSLDRTYAEAVRVSYLSVDGTAKSGEDYGAVAGILEFAPGETTKSVAVSIFGDTLPEASDIFYFDVTGVTEDLVITAPRVTGTIVNDDAIPTVSVQNTTVIEGEGGFNTYARVNVTLSNASLDPVTVTLSSLGVEIDPATDFTPFSVTITFAPGVTSVIHEVVIASDNLHEPMESFALALSNPTAAVLGNANATLTISDDDTWTIVSEPQVFTEGTGGSTIALVKLRLVNAFGVANHEHPIEVRVSPESGGTAGSNDFSFLPKRVIFAPGELEATFSVQIVGDDLVEQAETVLFRLSDPIGAKLGGNPVGQFTILNDDPAEVWIAASPSRIEGDSGVTMMDFTVKLSAPMNVPVSVNFHTESGTALAGVDFQAVAGELIFAPGEIEKIISVPIFGDLDREPDENFTMHLSDPSGIELRTPEGFVVVAGTILNDDPTINIEDVQILEGETSAPGTHKVYVPVRLPKVMDTPVSVDFQTVNGTAIAGSDYIPKAGTITFAPGQTIQYIDVEIISDMIFENDEVFYVNLSDANGADIMKGVGEITIKSDEAFITTSGSVLSESNSPLMVKNYNVILSQASTSVVTVHYTTQDGTAQVGSDYEAVSGILTFLPGETFKRINVTYYGDDLAEADETFSLVLFQPDGAGLPGGVESMSFPTTLVNDDPWLQITSGNVSNEEGQSGAKSLAFTVTLSQTRTSTVTVNYATVDGSALAGSDYTPVSGVLTFAPGQTSAVVVVPILGDVIPENDESFGLQLFDATGATTPAAPVVGTIVNDDVSFSEYVGLTISKNGLQASWVDTDGDLISLVSNKPIFNPDRFQFGVGHDGSAIILERLEVSWDGKGAPSLQFSVTKSATGDGVVNISMIDAVEQDLKKVTLPGTLGSIQAGDVFLKSKAIATLTVNGFGIHSSASPDAPTLSSEILGSVGSFNVLGNFVGADLRVLNGNIGTLKIGGDVRSDSAAAATSIVVDGSLSKMLVGGDIRGFDPSTPLVIEAAKGEVKKSVAALGRLDVGGDVENAEVRVQGAAMERGVRVGQIRVDGDWRASNLLVGAAAGEDGWVGTEDDIALHSSISKIARIRMDGGIFGTSDSENADDHFGFVAGRIAAFQVAGQKLGLSKGLDVIQPSADADDVMLREVAVS